MLSIAPVGGAGAASSYYTKDNYYTADAAQETSSWAGEGAEKAGLQGSVGIEEFKAILEGKMPDGAEMGTGPDGKRAVGFDMTFSAPKSLSMLAYIGGDERLTAANLSAAKVAIAWAEKNLAETRMKGADGKMETVKTGNLVVATFQHDTNRNLDPQAHVHAVVANATLGPDGKWRALHNGKIWQAYSTIASVYNAQLRTEVEKLGYRIELTGKHGQFEIAGVSREAIMAFSTRRQEVLEAFSQLTHQNDKTRNAVTIKTRAKKSVVENRNELRAEWTERAEKLGLDLPKMVDQARESSREGADVWDRATGAVNGVRAQAARVVEFIRERLGLSEKDPLMSDRQSSLGPKELGAEKSVASAIRSLSEREAAFTPAQLMKTALDLGLPITVDDVERRVAVLQKQGRLVRGRDDRHEMLTTPGAISTEQKLLTLVDAGRGRGDQVIATPEQAGDRLQAAAEARQGFRLNHGQEAAGRLLLAGTDRIVAVQGVAGAGKSSALGAVAEVAREEGRNVIGLGLQNTLVRMLERDTGIASMTITRFIGTHQRVLDEKISPERLQLARSMFRGSLLLVDEASMASNDQAMKLAAIADRLEVGRLAFVGDKRQLGAVDAGKPFEVMQASGTLTAEMNINLRARTPALISAAAAANDSRPADALAALKPMTTEAPGNGAALAAERYLGLSPEDRDRTMLLASGRRVRAEINTAVQAGLFSQGALKGPGAQLTVLDKVTTTREEERYLQTYAVGQRVDFERGVPTQGIGPGKTRVTGIDQQKGIVELVDDNGRRLKLNPQKLAPNRTENSVRISQEKQLRLLEGDKIRWTDTDKKRGLINADQARILKIDAAGVTVETSTKMQVLLPKGDPMLERLDLAYALNAHMVQGLTADRGIGVLDSRERNLTNERLFLVTITRVRDNLDLIVDNDARVERGIVKNTGEKTSALETTGDVQIDRYGRPQRQSGAAPQPGQATPDPRGPSQQGPAPQPQEPSPPITEQKPTATPPEKQPRVPVPERQLDFGL